MPLVELAYRTALAGARAVSPLLSRGSSKLARGIRGRAGAVERLVAWAEEDRDPDRPLVWFHAPSVGEALQAQAVRDALPDEPQVVLTHFSPSAEPWRDRFRADAVDYLPWDLRADVSRVLDALRPSVLVFTKTEVWPTLSAEAEADGVPMALVAATLPEGSSRLGPLSRVLLRPAFSRLSRVLAISEADAERFEALGVAPDRREVTGDPAIDSAAERAAAADLSAPHMRFGSADLRVIAGSTWPADEAVLLPALARLRESVPVEVIVAPHEPAPDRVRELVDGLAGAGFRSGTLTEHEAISSSGAEPGPEEGLDAVVVDRVGVLADLYRVADVAFVGGGFHPAGLHSVLEPAAAGRPVLFGPGFGGSRAARDLLGADGARVVTDSDGLEHALANWVRDPESRERAGDAARRYIARHRGAARTTARALLGLAGLDDGSTVP